MADQQASTIQEALNKLIKGQYEVILNPDVGRTLPKAIGRLAVNNKIPAVEALLSHLKHATKTPDPKLKLAAVSCLIATAKALAGHAQWNQIHKLSPTLKVIAAAPNIPEVIRTDAGQVLRAFEAKDSVSEVKAAKPEQKKSPIEIEEDRINRILATGDRELAGKKLYDLAESCARNKDFFNAERLRDRFYEIDPMALTEILQLGQIIEREQSGSISKYDLQKWTDLRRKLDEEEFNRLFYSMEIRTFKPDTTFVSKGDKNDELYFISMGCVLVSQGESGEERALTTLKTGGIIGENFFDSSFWTVSLITLELSKVMALKRDVFDGLLKKFPDLETKLRDFYEKESDVAGLLEQKNIDRRRHERFEIERRILVQIIGGNDKVLSSFNGKMKDVSQGGAGFSVRIPNRETSRVLLGKTTKIIVPVMKGKSNKLLRGAIIGVRLQDPVTGSYTVHVKFDQVIEYQSFRILLE